MGGGLAASQYLVVSALLGEFNLVSRSGGGDILFPNTVSACSLPHIALEEQLIAPSSHSPLPIEEGAGIIVTFGEET